jgi:uncharacterized protein YjiS (DUF1127 family)
MSTHSVTGYESASRENVSILPRLTVSPHRRLIATLSEWRRRMRSRRELASLSLCDLKDIGYPPLAAAERAKPFWRA